MTSEGMGEDPKKRLLVQIAFQALKQDVLDALGATDSDEEFQA